MAEIVKDNVPIWLFDSKEKYFPCSYEFFVENSTLHNIETGDLIDDEPTLEFLGKLKDDSKVSLRPKPEAWRGMPCSAPVYAHISILKNKSDDERKWKYRISYNVLYMYNGNIFVIPAIKIGTHGGDIEYVELTLDYKTKKLESVHMARHADEGVTLRPEQCQFQDGRLLIYVARESHASHEKAGRSWRFAGFANDVFDGKGLVWMPKPLINQDWYRGWDGEFGTTSSMSQRTWIRGGSSVPEL